jgi:hypothetical protein
VLAADARAHASELFAVVASNPEADLPERSRVVRLCALALPRAPGAAAFADTLLCALNYAAATSAAGVASQLPHCADRGRFCALARAATAMAFFATAGLLPTRAAAARERRRQRHALSSTGDGDGGGSGSKFGAAALPAARDVRMVGLAPPPPLVPPPPLGAPESASGDSRGVEVSPLAVSAAPLTPALPPPESPRTLRRGWPHARAGAGSGSSSRDDDGSP